MNLRRVGLGFVLTVFCFSMLAQGEIPRRFYFEDYYYVSNDVPYTGDIDLQLKLYDAATNGTYLYEDSNTVEVVDGFYATLIGDDTVYGSLSNALIGGEAYVEVIINGSNLPPREPLIPVPYALRAAGVASNVITSAMIASDAIQTSHLDSGVVSADKLASDVDDRYVNVSGDSMTGNLDMAGNQVTNLSIIVFKKNPSYMANLVLSNYYSTLYLNGGGVYAGGSLSEPGFSLISSQGSLWLKSLQYAVSGQWTGTYYTAGFETTTNVMNEIKVTGHLNMQGSAISNAVISGDGSGLTNLPTSDSDDRYVNVTGDTLTGPVEVDASSDQTNLIVAGWTEIEFMPPQGGIAMGIYTNR